MINYLLVIRSNAKNCSSNAKNRCSNAKNRRSNAMNRPLAKQAQPLGGAVGPKATEDVYIYIYIICVVSPFFLLFLHCIYIYI